MGTTIENARAHAAEDYHVSRIASRSYLDRLARGRRRSLAVVVVAMLAATAACGSDDDGADATSPPVTDSPAATAGEPPPATDHDRPDETTLTIEGFSFGPPLEVPVGTTVRVINTDSAPHTWTATDGSFDSGNLSAGDEFTHTFDEPGEYEYSCAFHPSMTGTITVTP